MIKFFSKPGKNRLFLASGKSMFCGEGCMTSRFTVTMRISMVVVWHGIFHDRFRFLGSNYYNLFYDCNCFVSLGGVC